jgi:8-oxo-dGTP diphosphatase
LSGRALALLRLVPDYAGILRDALRIEAGTALQVVQGVIVRDGRVLLARRDTLRGFELPGGNLRPGEDARTALVRELREETGLEVRVEDRVGRYSRSGFFAHRAEVYRCAVCGGSLRPSRETPELGWFAPNELPEELFRWFRGPLEDALAGVRGVERYEYQGLGAIWHGLCVDLRSRLRGAAKRRG